MINLDNSFEQNLAAYVDANATVAPTDFKVKRELDIARHALEESLALHKVVCTMLKNAIQNLGDTEGDVYKLVSLANNLEERHRKLQNSAKVVASIAKQGAEIESLLASKLDAAQVFSIIVQLPELLLSLCETQMQAYLEQNGLRFAGIDTVNSDAVDGNTVNGNTVDAVNTLTVDAVKEISHTVANRFNEEVEKSVNVLTYGGNTNNDTRNDSGVGVVEEQVVAMLETVPMGTVLEKDSTEARALESA